MRIWMVHIVERDRKRPGDVNKFGAFAAKTGSDFYSNGGVVMRADAELAMDSAESCNKPKKWSQTL